MISRPLAERVLIIDYIELELNVIIFGELFDFLQCEGRFKVDEEDIREKGKRCGPEIDEYMPEATL